MLVLDSNTISYYFRGDSQVVPRLQALSPADIGVPAIVEYELRYVFCVCGPRQPISVWRHWPLCCDRCRFCRFIANTRPMPTRIRAELEAAGTPIGAHDTLIAATALRHQATLVTRNVREFARVPGLQCLNWHQDS